MPKRPRIMVDFDGTSAQVGPRIRAAFSRTGGKKNRDFFDVIQDPNQIRRAKPVKGAKRTLRDLHTRFDIDYVTSQPDTPERRRTIQAWLREQGFPRGKLYLRPPAEGTVAFKARIAKKRHPVVSIGDLVTDLFSAREAGVPHIMNKTDTFPREDRIRREAGTMRKAKHGLGERIAHGLNLRGLLRSEGQ